MSFFRSSTPVAQPEPNQTQDQLDWLSQQEGQLAVDVFRDGDTLVIRSAIAGIVPENLDVVIDGDLLTIRGHRQHKQETNEDDWFVQECYWGSFSRSIVLPLDVVADRTDATIKNGILEIRLPIRSERQLRVRAIDF